MLMLALGLTVFAVACELMIVAKVPILRELLEKHAILSFVFSLTLSWLIGWMFGAAGLIVMIAAMGSTMITWIIYRVMNLFSRGNRILKSRETPIINSPEDFFN